MDYIKSKIGNWIESSYKTACEHGFHDKGLSIEHMVMLIIGELGEAVEADRSGKRANVGMFERESVTPQPRGMVESHKKFCFQTFIKDTVEDELADVAIRIFDTCGVLKITPKLQFGDVQLDKFVKEFSFCESCFAMCSILVHSEGASLSDDGTMECLPCVFGLALLYLFMLSERYGIDLEKHIELKLWYNTTREKRHGKSY